MTQEIHMQVERDVTATSPLGMVEHDGTVIIDVTVEFEVVGRSRPATHLEPAEEPELEILSVFDDDGNEVELTASEEAEAIDACWDSFDPLGDCPY